MPTCGEIGVASPSRRVLITGIGGFTGRWLAARLTEAGVGVAIVPGPLVAIMSTALHVLPIHPEVHAQIALAWRTEGPVNPAAQAFLRQVRGGR